MDDVQTVGEIIQEMVDRGYELNCGPHHSSTGYFAQFYIDDESPPCLVCSHPHPALEWEDAGHGHTFDEGIETARDLALGYTNREVGYTIPLYKPEDFPATNPGRRA